MSAPLVKAFVLCEEITDSSQNPVQKDLQGAGLTVISAPDRFPMKHTFWVYLEIADQKTTGEIQLAIMRADSGRRFFFREMSVAFWDPLHSTIVAIRVFDCVIPASGVYFVELWYDAEWQLDQRVEVL
jgi:hypothetical protein